MANSQATFGFRQIGYLSGGAPDYQLTTRAIQSSNTTKIGFGDPVVKANATSNYIIQAVGTTVVTTPIIGIFQGCQYTPAGGAPTWSPYWPGAAALDAVAYIVDAPNALFLAATFLTAIATGAIGQTVAFTGTVPSTTGGGFSSATLDAATLGTAGGTAASFLPFRVIGMYPGVGNGSDPTTNYNWVVVGFNFESNRALNV
jgi:hypothetical protein